MIPSSTSVPASLTLACETSFVHQPDRSSFDLEKEEKDLQPWESLDFIPKTESGRQKSPETIREELQQFIRESNRTQISVIREMGVNRNSFHKFMNPTRYKDPWNATENSTYWAAGRLLEKEKFKKEHGGMPKPIATAATTKRKAVAASLISRTVDSTDTVVKKERRSVKLSKLNACTEEDRVLERTINSASDSFVQEQNTNTLGGSSCLRSAASPNACVRLKGSLGEFNFCNIGGENTLQRSNDDQRFLLQEVDLEPPPDGSFVSGLGTIKDANHSSDENECSSLESFLTDNL